MHPFISVPVTVYVVLTAGFAETTAPVVGVNPVVGDQVYVEAPLAVSVNGDPPGMQTDPEVGDTITVGSGLINTDFSTVVTVDPPGFVQVTSTT